MHHLTNTFKMMKIKSLLIAGSMLILPWSSQAQESKNADLKEVTNHLDMDGQFFMANNIEGDLGKLAVLGTDFVKTARENGSKRFSKDIDFNAVLKDMGMDQLFAYGRSAKHAEDHWVNKMYLQNGGSTKGVFSMLGEKNSSFDVLKYAPSGSDMVLEWNIDTRQLMGTMKNLPSCEKMERFLERKVPLGGTTEDMLNKFTAKMSLAVKLDDETREVCPIYPEYTFPKIHGCMRMQGANQIWEQVGAIAAFVLKIEKQEDGTLLMTPRRKKKGMTPVMIMDEKNDLLWVATSPEFLTECRNDNGAKLIADENFKAISDGATKGNAVAYISRQACLEIRQVKEAKYKKKGKMCLSDDMMNKIMDHLTESKNGYFAAIHKSEKGINMILKAPCPVKEIMCAKGRCGKKRSCKGCTKGRCTKGPKGACKSCDKDSCEGDKKGKESKCHEGQCDECKCEKTKDSCKCENECKCSKSKDAAPQSKPKAEKAPAKKTLAPKKTAPQEDLKSKEAPQVESKDDEQSKEARREARRADRAAKRASEKSE